jgi:hypothetical protein
VIEIFQGSLPNYCSALAKPSCQGFGFWRTNVYGIDMGQTSPVRVKYVAATAGRTDRKLCGVVEPAIRAGKTAQDRAWPRLPVSADRL